MPKNRDYNGLMKELWEGGGETINHKYEPESNRMFKELVNGITVVQTAPYPKWLPVKVDLNFYFCSNTLKMKNELIGVWLKS